MERHIIYGFVNHALYQGIACLLLFYGGGVKLVFRPVACVVAVAHGRIGIAQVDGYLAVRLHPRCHNVAVGVAYGGHVILLSLVAEAALNLSPPHVEGLVYG